jgi:hypothetical protein
MMTQMTDNQDDNQMRTLDGILDDDTDDNPNNIPDDNQDDNQMRTLDGKTS